MKRWIKILIANLIIFLLLIVLIELFMGITRIVIGKKFYFPLHQFDPCREMKTDVLLSHVPNHRGQCNIKNGYADGEYVRYNSSKLSNPVLLTLGGSTTAGFYQHFSEGDTYPNYLSQMLASDYAILNGGVGGYSSLQELFKIIRDAPRIKNLHTVISLNGTNDVPDYQGLNEIRKFDFPFLSSIQARMNSKQIWTNQSLTTSLQQILPNLNSLITYLINRSDNDSIKSKVTINNPKAVDAADRWLINVTRMHSILQAQGVRYYVFLQPTMGLEGPQSSPTSGTRDERVFKKLLKPSFFQGDYIQVIRTLYSQLKKHCLTINYCFDISDEVPPKGNMYKDPRHHNSEGNYLLAQIIADIIREQDSINSP